MKLFLAQFIGSTKCFTFLSKFSLGNASFVGVYANFIVQWKNGFYELWDSRITNRDYGYVNYTFFWYIYHDIFAVGSIWVEVLAQIVLKAHHCIWRAYWHRHYRHQQELTRKLFQVAIHFDVFGVGKKLRNLPYFEIRTSLFQMLNVFLCFLHLVRIWITFSFKKFKLFWISTALNFALSSFKYKTCVSVKKQPVFDLIRNWYLNLKQLK